MASSPPSGSSPKYPASTPRATGKAGDNTEEWLDNVEELLKSSPPGQAASQDLTRSLVDIIGEGLEDGDSAFTQSMRLLDKLTEAVSSYNYYVKDDLRAPVEAAIRAQEREREYEMEEFAEAGEIPVHKDTPFPTPVRDTEMLREDPKGATGVDLSLNMSYRPAGFYDDSTATLSEEDIYLEPECGRCGDVFDHFRSRNGIPHCGCWSGDSEEDVESHLSRLEDLHL